MKIRYAIVAVAAAALLLAGCSNTEGEAPTTPVTQNIEPDATAAALLPEETKAAGVLNLGSDLGAAPNEYKDADGNPTGWGVELAEAVAAKLGLEPQWEVLEFSSILPRIEEDAIDMGAASFKDTLERQKTVDFVDYVVTGTQWAAATGTDVDPDDACGLTVAVAQGTIQHTTQLPERSDACVADGEPAIELLVLDKQPDLPEAVIQGRADALAADISMSGDYVAKRSDELHFVGEVYGTAPQGFATKKGSAMTKAIQAAVQSLIDDGTYLEILAAAGLEDAAISEATVNAGTE